MPARTYDTKLQLNFILSSPGKEKDGVTTKASECELEVRPGSLGNPHETASTETWTPRSKLNIQTKSTGNSENVTGDLAAVNPVSEVARCLLQLGL